MEITSLRWSANLLQRENSRNNNRIEKPEQQENRHGQIIFQVPETDESPVDFSAISPRDLRALALENYQAGKIDQETYITLSEELPHHAVDAQGQVIDLSQVTDETGFDFHDYYRNQLDIAMSLGDAHRADVLRSVMAFLEI
ncbi:hypothetical protein QTA58_11135 [Neorhizobium sp. CSC1952]|uniref:Uncharacterized protein n=1 Tax=Xaviernesmea oryzae TaxID=464029 RepID=A0A1X7CIL4_9HYPH|nr:MULTISPECIES: hypothetical protein [Rhizobium/Agrobacterium group]WJR69247.1 hypothetical protein QTA58_11135 [Rhizobium sp. CSC1952]SME97387.1 hypothetical protein SAMN02982989_0373 [Xaviernesmea oryzae]